MIPVVVSEDYQPDVLEVVAQASQVGLEAVDGPLWTDVTEDEPAVGLDDCRCNGQFSLAVRDRDRQCVQASIVFGVHTTGIRCQYDSCGCPEGDSMRIPLKYLEREVCH